MAIDRNNRRKFIRSNRTSQTFIREYIRILHILRHLSNSVLINPSLPISHQNINFKFSSVLNYKKCCCDYSVIMI